MCQGLILSCRNGQIWHVESWSFFFCSYFTESLISFVISILWGILHEWCKKIPTNPSVSPLLFIYENERKIHCSHWKNIHIFMFLNEKLVISRMSNKKKIHVHLMWNLSVKEQTSTVYPSCSPVILCVNSPSVLSGIMVVSKLNACRQTVLTDEDTAWGSHTSCRVPTCFLSPHCQ